MKYNLVAREKSIWYRCSIKVIAVLLIVLFLFASAGLCQEPAVPADSTRPYQHDMKPLILLLKQKGLISEEETNDLFKRLTQEGEKVLQEPESSAPFKKEKSETLQEDIEATREKLSSDVDQLLQRDRLTERRVEELEKKVSEDIAERQYQSSWAQRVKLNGDLRLRYQKEFKDEGNEDRLGANGVEPTNIDRERYRYRARLGIKAKLIDPRETNVGKVELGFRLASGNDDDPVSTNTTMGDYFDKDDIWIDRAYLNWKWKTIDQVMGGKIPQISLTGGRMPNPFLTTDLVWDSDLSFEGATLNFTSDVFEGNSWRLFLTTGAYPLDEYEFKNGSKWFYGGQIGFEHRPFWGLNYKVAVGYYDFRNVKGEPITEIPDIDDIDYDWGESQYAQGGNTLVDLNRLHTPGFDDEIIGLAADYTEIQVTAMIDIDRFFPIHVILWGDYVQNIGYDKDEIRNRYSDIEVPDYQLDQTKGYQFGITLGYPKVRAAGEWSTSIFYKYLEADAVLDAFTDSDFNLGGTDSKGYILKAEYGLYKNIWLTARYLSTNEIIEESGQFAVDTLQLDLSAEF